MPCSARYHEFVSADIHALCPGSSKLSRCMISISGRSLLSSFIFVIVIGRQQKRFTFPATGGMRVPIDRRHSNIPTA